MTATTPAKAAEYLTSRQSRPGESPLWLAYHGATAAALSGDLKTAQRCLATVKATSLDPPWAQNLAAKAAHINSMIEDGDDIREFITATIATSRSQHSLLGEESSVRFPR